VCGQHGGPSRGGLLAWSLRLTSSITRITLLSGNSAANLLSGSGAAAQLLREKILRNLHPFLRPRQGHLTIPGALDEVSPVGHLDTHAAHHLDLRDVVGQAEFETQNLKPDFHFIVSRVGSPGAFKLCVQLRSTCASPTEMVRPPFPSTAPMCSSGTAPAQRYKLTHVKAKA
jgi:hypothetical protein